MLEKPAKTSSKQSIVGGGVRGGKGVVTNLNSAILNLSTDTYIAW